MAPLLDLLLDRGPSVGRALFASLFAHFMVNRWKQARFFQHMILHFQKEKRNLTNF